MKRHVFCKGFSILEVMIVIVILAALLGGVIPRLRSAIDRGKNMEAENMLYAIFNAQQDVRRRTGAFTTVEADLDLTIPAMKHFTLQSLEAGTTEGCSINGALAEIRSLDTPAYDLWIDANGTIWCEIGNDCSAAACVKMGY